MGNGAAVSIPHCIQFFADANINSLIKCQFGVPEDESSDNVINSWPLAQAIYDLDGPIPRLFYEYEPVRLYRWHLERGSSFGATNPERVKMMLQNDPYDLT